jgi:hypothetical protein
VDREVVDLASNPVAIIRILLPGRSEPSTTRK